MDDKAWNDYLTGLNTGVSYNVMSEMGARHAYKPPTAEPPPEVIPISPPISQLPITPPAVFPNTRPTTARQTPSPRQHHRRSGADRWIWNLAETLSDGFDRRADRLISTRFWRWLIVTLAVAGGLSALAWALSEPAVRSLHWGFTLAALAAGAVAAPALPWLLLLAMRLVLWLLGTVVWMTAVLTLMALAIGAGAGAFYAAAVVYQALN
jgi:hypothetical protein